MSRPCRTTFLRRPGDSCFSILEPDLRLPSCCNWYHDDNYKDSCNNFVFFLLKSKKDQNILSKSLAEKLKSALPELISSNQTAYVKNRCISESGRLISDVIEMCDILDISGYLVTMDIEKAFDSLDHDFLLFVLKKIGFGENFIH